jgi:SRSO17 transposase
MNPRSRLVKCRVSRRPPASGRKPLAPLSSRDVALSLEALLAYHQDVEALFQRREQQEWSFFYLCGQLANLERKAIEPMVLTLLGAKPNLIRAVQQFMGQGTWAVEPLVEHLQRRVAEWLGEPDGVVIIDGSGFPKQGPASVGVAYQYCGHLGKLANCQEGVFLVYASRHGYAFLDERLYMPEDWFSAEAQSRRRQCGVPATLTFQTEPELGVAMIQGLCRRAVVPFRWVTCDESYGKSPAFLEEIEALNKWYLAEVPADTRVWQSTPRVEPPGPGLFGRPRIHPRVRRTAPAPQELRAMLAQMPAAQWHRRVIKEGSKGPLVAEFAVLRVTPVREKLPGSRCWAIFRRTLGAKPEVKFYLSNAPSICPQAELVRLSGMRWPVETVLEESKGEIGLDHYQLRTWRGWHHHRIQSFLAHLFLIRLRILFQKKPRPHDGPGAPVDCAGDRGRSRQPAQHPVYAPLSPRAKSCRLSLPSQAHADSALQATAGAAKRQSLVFISEVSYSYEVSL